MGEKHQGQYAMSWERVGLEGERIGSEEEVGSSGSLRYRVVGGPAV